MERLHILDGYGYIFRAFYGIMYGGKDGRQVRLSTKDGMPTGALYVYASMLIRLQKDIDPKRVVVVFDSPGPSFRKELDPEYKANRSEMPDELREQMPFFRPLTEAFSWPVVAVPGFEADDVIATLVRLAQKRKWAATVYSADKDLMQLVGDDVSMIDAMRQRTYDYDAVVKKFGVGPDKVRDWLALVGDTSDNVPGMAGVGPKTAAKLLTEHGDLEGVLAATDSFKGKMKERFTDPDLLDAVKRSAKLVTLVEDVELPVQLDDLVKGEPKDAELKGLFDKFQFQALWERIGRDTSELEETNSETEQKGADEAKPAAEISIKGDTKIAGSDSDIAKWLKVAGNEVALHLETSDARLGRQIPISLTLASANQASLYINLGHRYLGAPQPLELEKLSSLKKLLRNKKTKLACFDGKRIIRVLQRSGLEVLCKVFDVMLASYVADPSVSAKSLEAVAQVTGVEGLTLRKVFLGTGKKARTFEEMQVEEASVFAAENARAVLACTPTLVAKLESTGQTKLLEELETPVTRALAFLEDKGVCLDTDFLHQLSDRIGSEVHELEELAFKHAGENFNLGSPKQLSALLFDKLGLTSPKMRKTKTGYSTDHQVLDSMRDAHPVIEPILRHRELVKLKNTFIDALIPLVNPETGRLHTDFRQAVAATGRLSSVNPNLQNIPIRSELGREIRRGFVGAPGKVLVSADYSQIELRVLAHLSEDPVLIRAFAEEIDVHTQTASEVFGIGLDEVGQYERRVAKAVNYGLVYGQSDFGLSQALEIPRSEAKHYIERYFERFSTVAAFMKTVVEKARTEGGAVTILGRKRPLPDLSAKNFMVRSAAERMAQNTPMQGSGADIMKLALLGVHDAIQNGEFAASLILTVHDELVLEVDESLAEDVGVSVAKIMESVYDLKVPLKVDVGIGPNWAEAH